LARILDEERGRFDLTRPPLLRFALVRLGDEHWRFALTNHHVLLDGWSLPLLYQELFGFYSSDGSDAALPRVVPYRDYVSWLAGQDREEAEQAWAEALDGVSEPTLLVDVPTRTQAMPEHLSFALPAEQTSALVLWARDRGVTLNTVVQAAWAIVLGRLTGRDDVVFGATVS
ncbi:hypothetical protein ADK60_24860, partial [Streptomyces sp. XY431]|uniref:condensation domain-containing protein n=1 Tax=Streptomyces sp. XY431 TaxID=1415562 RepID=UPI0006BFC45F